MALGNAPGPERRSPGQAAAGAFGRALAGGAGIGALAGMAVIVAFFGVGAGLQEPPGRRLGILVHALLMLPLGLVLGILFGLAGALLSGLILAALAPWWRPPTWPARCAGAVICAAPVLLTSAIGTWLEPAAGPLWPMPVIVVPAALVAAAGGARFGPWLLRGSTGTAVGGAAEGGGAAIGGGGVRRNRGRRWATAGTVLLLVLTGPGETLRYQPAQRIEVVAGAGASNDGAAPDRVIDGRLVDMAMDDTGTLRVLTTKKMVPTLWSVRDGRLSRLDLPGIGLSYAGRMATGPGGMVYFATGGTVVRVGPDGSVVRVLGRDRPKADQVREAARKPAVDGEPADGAFLNAVDGVAVSGSGQLHVVENRVDGNTYQLVRTVRDGRLRTLLGRDLRGLEERDRRAASVVGGFADGTAGTRVAIDDGAGAPLAVGPDASVYVTVGHRSVVRVMPDGTAYTVVGHGADGTGVRKPWVPGRDRGPAARASIWSAGTYPPMRGADNANLVVDANGDVYLPSALSAEARLPEAFNWLGATSDTQQAVLDQARDDRWKDTVTEVLRITPDGRIATAAGHADLVAVHGGWLYLAQGFQDQKGADRAVIVRTAIPR